MATMAGNLTGYSNFSAIGVALKMAGSSPVARANSTYASGSIEAASLTYSYNVASSISDPCLVVLVANSGGVNPIGVTYAGVAMTLVEQVSVGTYRCSTWVKPTPTVGANNVVVSFAGATGILSGAGLFKNVDQTAPARTPAVKTNGTTESSYTLSEIIATLNEDLLVGVFTGNSNTGTRTPITSQLERISISSGPMAMDFLFDEQAVNSTFPIPDTPRPPQDQGPPAGPSGGDPGAAFPPTGIGRMRRERLARKQQREQRTQQAQVLRRIPSQARGDQIDKSAPPRGTAPVEPRKWLVFGWTTPAVMNSQKTLTLRAMGPVEAVQWRMGELVYAYDRDPSEGGERLALLRLTHDPYEVSTVQLRKSDFNALGFGYLQAMGITAPNGNTPAQIWQRMQQAPERLYVVRFRVERLYDSRAPTRGSVSV